MDADADIVLSIDDEDGRVKGPIGSVMIGAVELPFTADSGSPLTLISDRTFDLKWQDVRLHETDVNPKAFGEHDILMRGYFWDSLTFRGHTVRTKIYVAEKGRSLVGWKDLAKLGVMLVPGAEDPIVLRDDWVNYVQPEDLHEGLAEVLDKFDSVFENKDDILIHTEDEEGHLELLGRVLEVLKKRGMTVSKDKCKFMEGKIEYLGHVLTPNGIAPKDDLVRAIRDAPCPGDKDALRPFLGLYSKFMQGYATTVEPLRKLLQKNEKYTWTQEQSAAFESVKQAIAAAPVLQPYNKDLRNVITVDASAKGRLLTSQPIRIVDGCDVGGRRDEDKKRSARTRAGGGAPGGSSWALLFVARK
ncbi:hypothetical protein NDU88_001148 [Pleurodeles waltl]|uniref:ribonuclease H n=1 Tax=Pleurodeles waltl TaxID=8319 RepID=A0AAV7SYN3_PLEWA|nr:hypothetical protein NDU88_001148 [Pleurodeles waltl]